MNEITIKIKSFTTTIKRKKISRKWIPVPATECDCYYNIDAEKEIEEILKKNKK